MLTYDMNNRGESPLYEHLYHCIRKDIESGAISANEKLPSKRTLARNLGVSVITVEGAYTQLAAEGYIRALERRGYYACALPQRKQAASLPSRLEVVKAPFVRPDDAVSSPVTPGVIDLSGSAIAHGLFPYSVWAKNLRATLSEESEWSLIGESATQGSLRLRTALCNYLRGARGMQVQPDQIVIGAGAQYLYGMVVQLLGRSNVVALEDPGYPRLPQIYAANGVNTVSVALDDEGIRMEALEHSGATLAHVMPSHQFPTGQVTSIARRYELLGWAAKEPGRYIIEDDYDCELRLHGKPVPSLQSIDAQGQVIYINTFTKTLGPAFRIGYLVLPPALAQAYASKLGFYSCTVGAIDQLALARFIESGEYERHVNRLRIHHRNTVSKLTAALKETTMGQHLRFENAHAGSHFVLTLDSSLSESELAASALRHGVKLTPLGSFRALPLQDQHRRFVVSYEGLDEASIPAVAQALQDAWAQS